MKNYIDSDYALNKYSNGITYRFADGTTLTVTLADYLAENPDGSEEDFRILKELSDNNYFLIDRTENAQTKRNISLDRMFLIDGRLPATFRHAPSTEDVYMGETDAQEKAVYNQRQIETMRRALDRLTDIQRRRYIWYHADGLSTWQIAGRERVNQKSVYESLQAAEKKIKKFLKKS